MYCKWLAAALLLCVAATGCGTVARNETSPSPQSHAGVRTQQVAPREAEVITPGQLTAHLERLAQGVRGVKGAHCVVLGNTAVVGIDVDSKVDRSHVGTIKYSVAEAFRKDPYGINAIVTADMDLNERLRELSEDIRAGRPIAGFAEELADIVGRIVPQIPRHITPSDTEPDPSKMPKA
ncbi:YhcN/YlaJ family sporulation lipoprotein [Paenibacillus cisolokensis]|jgi:YhcN/YlaJ family sporulation lipoprotein|uniref:YhcN/YlaJ family sporulation lipoprotein n=1 Tax=Paenibacillus TaxID=44249 RepID=UPI00071EA6E6|nr:YhcN/YlaJ family sporulation lipoprotein [Paenibacillus sp. 32O-W]ALS27332.1 sporulation protein [Paenibacillus sp. 32O-W]